MAQQKEESEKPNYYAVIPAKVRFDTGLPLGARVLFGEIVARTGPDGVCRTSIESLANCYQVSASTIQRWLSSLQVHHYLTIQEDTSQLVIHARLF